MTDSIAELKVSQLKKRGPGFRLEADFAVASGERAALLGPSGAGKTTLLRVLAGLDPFEPGDEGRILLGASDVTRVSPQKRNIGVVFQEQLLFPALDVVANAAFGLRMRGTPRLEAEQQALGWLEKVGLRERAHSPVTELSGGERQRVAWIRALIWKPSVLLLDEPFTALDSALKEALRSQLRELHSEWPVPMILVSHDERDVDAIATSRLRLVEAEGGSVRRVLRG